MYIARVYLVSNNGQMIKNILRKYYHLKTFGMITQTCGN